MSFGQQDFEQLVKIARALERIAKSLETLAGDDQDEEKKPRDIGFGRPS